MFDFHRDLCNKENNSSPTTVIYICGRTSSAKKASLTSHRACTYILVKEKRRLISKGQVTRVIL